MNIINQAEERFKPMLDELCEILFPMLREITALEREILPKYEDIMARWLTDNKPAPDEDKILWSEYKERYFKIVRDRCTEKLLGKGCGDCINSTPKYAFIDDEECDLIFTMKAPRRAVIEIHYAPINDCRRKFTLVKEGDRWLLNSFDWYSNYDCVWHRGSI